jgi:ATP-dependent Clp protease ATP-binding subunit ClpC
MSLISKNLLTEAHHLGAYNILHRDLEVSRLVRTTNRPIRNNPLLLGEPGVGKTALVKGLAFRLAHGALHASHIEKVLLVNTSYLAMLIGSQDMASMQKEQEELLGYTNTLLLIDDARLLFTQNDLTAMLYFLQPLLERKDLYVTLACSMAEYRRYIEKDPIFFREMEPIQVPELSLEHAQDAVMNVVATRMQETSCHIDADTVQQAVSLAKRYIPERSLPDKAVILLNEAIAKVLGEGRDRVEFSDCKQIVAEKTGIPVETLTASDQEKLLNLEKELDLQVIGQEHVTTSVARVIRRARAGLKDPGRPIASFLFLGSSGVGKTELAKVLTRTVYHNERALLRFDMSEFSEPHNVQRLVGAPPGYLGFEEGGQLTNAVLAQPYSLVLLDEIEKAHPKVFDIFLQVMDDGRLTDGKGRTVDFSNCIIIATSNIAIDEILRGFTAEEEILTKSWYEEFALPILGAYFRPEFINRFDDVLIFSPFNQQNLFKVAQLEVKKLQKRLIDQHIELSIDNEELQEIVIKLYNPLFGARPIRRYLQETIENDLAEQILRGERG